MRQRFLRAPGFEQMLGQVPPRLVKLGVELHGPAVVRQRILRGEEPVPH